MNRFPSLWDETPPAVAKVRWHYPIVWEEPDIGLLLRPIVALARGAVRAREETKSGLVFVTMRFKQAYRALAKNLVAEGKLPDEDAVFFAMIGTMVALPLALWVWFERKGLL